jgi:hypothetical protein
VSRLRRDLRGFLLSLCCAGGGLIGLWQGMLAVPTDAPDPNAWTAFGDVMQPILIGVGIGVAVGGMVATAVCLSVPWLRPTRDRL